MKTDDFDEIFRRKVESYHPPFENTEIDRIQGYVKQKMPLQWWQRFGSSLIYSFGSILIVSLLTTIYYQANENKRLLENISKLKSELVQNKSQKPVERDSINSYSNVFVEKIDTVYVFKKIEKELAFDDEKKGEVWSNPDEIGLEMNHKAKVLSQNKSFSLEKVGATSNIALEVEDNSSGAEPLIVSKNNEPIKATNLSRLSLKDIQVNAFTSKFFEMFSFPKTLTIVNFWTKSTETPSLEREKKHFDIHFPSIKLPKPKFRLGVGGSLDNSQRGVNVLSEILLAKKISLSTGISFAYMHREHFGNEFEFKRRTELDFREQHPLDIEKNAPIHDIDSKKIMIQLPILLNYRLPLKKDFTVLASTGTNLDLHLRQFTTYSHGGVFEDDNEESYLNQEIPTKVFNNWMFSLGLEKRWNRVSIQVNPFYGFHFKRLTYQPYNHIFGFRTNVFYRLGK